MWHVNGIIIEHSSLNVDHGFFNLLTP